MKSTIYSGGIINRNGLTTKEITDSIPIEIIFQIIIIMRQLQINL